MTRFVRSALPPAIAALLFVHAAGLPAQTTRISLETPDRLKLVNVVAAPATHDGRAALRVTMSPESAARMSQMPAQPAAPQNRALVPDQLAVIESIEFGNGVIEAEIAGAPAPGAAESARGFVGLAFRVQSDYRTFDAFYLRPTNGRAEDQERRNRSVQYISHPDWPWMRLRKETPAKYESYVDLVPGAWTNVKIDVRGASARLFVHDQAQPTLVVNDLKSGASARGAVALWVDVGTVAHFRNVRVTPAP